MISINTDPCLAPTHISNAATPACSDGPIMNHSSFCTSACVSGFASFPSEVECSAGQLASDFVCAIDLNVNLNSSALNSSTKKEEIGKRLDAATEASILQLNKEDAEPGEVFVGVLNVSGSTTIIAAKKIESNKDCICCTGFGTCAICRIRAFLRSFQQLVETLQPAA